MVPLAQHMNIASALDKACMRFGHLTALIEMDRDQETQRITYASLSQQAEEVKQHLGLQPGERMAIIMQNQSKWIIGALAAFRLGAILVPIDYKLSALEQASLLIHAKPTLLLTEKHQWHPLKEMISAPPLRVILNEEWEINSSYQNPSQSNHATIRKREDIACIVYSSGTSGTPKGCLMSHQNYLEQADILGHLFPIKKQARYFSILPTNHAIDFMCGFILPLLFGATVVHQRCLRPQYILNTLKIQRITHMAVVPLLLKMMAAKIQESMAQLPTWKQYFVHFLINLNRILTKKKPKHFISKVLLYPFHKQFGGSLLLFLQEEDLLMQKLRNFFIVLVFRY